MKVPLWIAWKELLGRKTRFLLNTCMVALAVGLCISMELISFSREQAVDTQINYMGPALRIVPEGITEGMLTRYESTDKLFPASLVPEIKKRFNKSVYGVEGRLFYKVDYKGATIPVIGFNKKNLVSPFKILKELLPGEAAVGYELSRELKLKQGDTLKLGDHSVKVKTILPTAANNEDAALFMNIKTAQKIHGTDNSLNEIRIFPRPGISTDSVAQKIIGSYDKINVIKAPKGEIADTKVESALLAYRVVLYGFAAFVVIIALMIGTHINASERKNELATLFAIGTTGFTVFLALISRAFFVGLLGASLGYLIGASAALIIDFNSAVSIVWSWKLFIGSIGVTIAVTFVATVPASIIASFRNHVLYLQEDY